ncbi:type IV toxin-antitoxin system AbiEi family antitoxin domain-containing protein [Phycicoccus sp. HDW14]|uniref:type IV toxin-antitoxin system AbiEi family antitoxin domain-containing protein n=1 Tax=Phycicoccus sp. HDW14 TaxID=2714941 RepID=UPI00140825AE|nr:type IV toxin-antitoxin system AbiEi family antitoxin domain-containing protein [Phycicoccus sp. HDW14]QIM21691.1 type IV toxin-antitoxin system AbiEi family antitoxin domain-containing protein [Phycicoccus sp. HDW14]
MLPDLRRILDGGQGVLDTAAAVRAGLSADDLRRAVSAGELRRVRRGLYAAGAVWDAAPPWERYRLTVVGVLAAHPGWVASHHAALVLHGLPMHGIALASVDVAAEVGTAKVRPGVHVHRLARDDRHLRSADPRALPPAVACAQVAARDGVEAGVVPMDAALHEGRCTRSDLRAALGHPSTGHGVAHARAAVDRADHHAESPGESRTRLLLEPLGVEVRTQVDLHDAAGLIGRASPSRPERRSGRRAGFVTPSLLHRARAHPSGSPAEPAEPGRPGCGSVAGRPGHRV